MKKINDNQNFDLIIIETINSFLDDSEKLNTMLLEYHPYDIMLAVRELDEERFIKLANILDKKLLADVFEYLDDDEIKDYFDLLPKNIVISIINNMENDDVVDYFKYLLDEDNLDEETLGSLAPKKHEKLKKILEYSEDSIGSMMSDSYFTLDKTMNVKESMKTLTKNAKYAEYIGTIYVLNEKKLAGFITLKNLIQARAEEIISNIMEERVISANALDDKENVALIMQDYGFTSLPIVNSQDEMIGIVTHDKLVDIIANLNKDDYLQFAAVNKDTLKDESVFTSVKKRIPWLIILLLLSTLTSFFLSLFEGGLSASALLATRLAIYLPLILDMSGNAGTQSLAVMIMALNENNSDLDKAKVKKHFLRELRIGIINGLVIMVLVILIVMITNLIGHEIIDLKLIVTAIMTGLSLLVALVIANVSGAFIPWLLMKFKVDPSVASGPFITTINDVVTLLIYYGIGLATLLPLYT